MKNIRFLHLHEVIALHYEQVKQHGGMHGIRDKGLLESALHVPQVTFQGLYLHNGIFEMAAAYGFGIIKNHPFFDGNKRTGIISMLLFLAYNKTSLHLSQNEFYNLAIDIATSKFSIAEIADILQQHSEVKKP